MGLEQVKTAVVHLDEEPNQLSEKTIRLEAGALQPLDESFVRKDGEIGGERGRLHERG